MNKKERTEKRWDEKYKRDEKKLRNGIKIKAYEG